MPKTLNERFWAKVSIKEPYECWVWTGCKSENGYGRFNVHGLMQRAHRFSFEIVNGAIPEGMLIDHICHNPLCVNPSHLRLATYSDNARYQKTNRSDNTSGYRGISWDNRKGKWRSAIKVNNKTMVLGRFQSIEDAYKAYVEAAQRLHGEFASIHKNISSRATESLSTSTV